MNPYKFGKPTLSLAAIGAAMLVFAGPCTAQSAPTEGNGIRVSGFGTLGVVHSEAPAGWGFRRSLQQPATTGATGVDVDTRLGVQINYAANSQVELVGQVLARRRPPDAAAGDAVEWAFAAYRPTADLAFRAGRLNLDQFLMSEFRNVGFAYHYARPPVEYYGTIPSNLDGADLTRTWSFDDTRWSAKGFLGRSRTTGIALTHVVGLSLARESDGLLVRAGWTRARLAHNFYGVTPLLEALDQVRALPIPSVSAEATALRGYMDLAAKPLTYATLGMTYEHGPWQAAAEVMRATFGNSDIKAGYASIGRRIGEVNLYGIVSGATGDPSSVATPAWSGLLTPVIGTAAAQQAQALAAMAAHAARQSSRQTTVSLGARWDIQPRVAINVQWDHVRIRANGGYLWSKATSDPGSATITTALLDFVF
jgi:hypothetical protein